MVRRLSLIGPLLVALAALTTFWILNADTVHGCSCAPIGSPLEAMGESTAVFAGRVVDIADFDHRDYRNHSIVSFEVDAVWKGPVFESMWVSTHVNGATCGFNFSEGEEYVVYARGTDAHLTASACNRTALMADAAVDLEVLAVGQAPQPGMYAPIPLDSRSLPIVGGCTNGASSAPEFLLMFAGLAWFGLRRRSPR